jgi:hypothetical protein
MTLKLFKALWFLSVLVVLANLLWVYASLPEVVTIQDDEQVTVSREWLFYALMLAIVVVNALVYLMKIMVPEAENLRSWFHGLIVTINIFVIAAMHAINVYNSGEIFDHNRVGFLISGSLATIIVWAALWPIYFIFQKFLLKQAV